MRNRRPSFIAQYVPMTPTTREIRLLLALSTLGIATAEMMNRAVGYAPGSLPNTTGALFRLFNAGLVERMPHRTKMLGNPAVVNKLSRKGVSLIRRKYRGDVAYLKTTAAIPMTHMLECIRPVVDALEITHTDSSLSLRYETEPFITRNELVLPATLGGKHIRPDGFLNFCRNNPDRMLEATFLLEVDRASESAKVITQKIDNYLLAEGSLEYFDRFQTERMAVVWLVDANDARLRQLVKITHDYLTKIHRTEDAELFLFGMKQPGTAHQFFFEPRFQHCTSDALRPLLGSNWGIA